MTEKTPMQQDQALERARLAELARKKRLYEQQRAVKRRKCGGRP